MRVLIQYAYNHDMLQLTHAVEKLLYDVDGFQLWLKKTLILAALFHFRYKQPEPTPTYAIIKFRRVRIVVWWLTLQN